ncbi:MAG: hypothetical protein MJ246_00770 [Clostridia bacterium]|nr:hypothetical protein [Clostridia bacterium]
MYGELHKLNAARSNRDIWQGAADDAKSNVRKVKGTDSWEKKSQPTEKQESMVKQTNESLEKTRDRLAEKTADLKATNAFDGNKDENKMFDQAKNLMEEAQAFNESSMKSNANREINLDSIKETIGETLKQCTSLANKDDYAILQKFCNTPSEGNSTATTDAFEKKVDARMETLKKSGVIK